MTRNPSKSPRKHVIESRYCHISIWKSWMCRSGWLWVRPSWFKRAKFSHHELTKKISNWLLSSGFWTFLVEPLWMNVGWWLKCFPLKQTAQYRGCTERRAFCIAMYFKDMSMIICWGNWCIISIIMYKLLIFHRCCLTRCDFNNINVYKTILYLALNV